MAFFLLTFHWKEVSKNFVIDSNWTSCRTIQGVDVLVISNRPRAPCMCEFEFTSAPLGPIIIIYIKQLEMKLLLLTSLIN